MRELDKSPEVCAEVDWRTSKNLTYRQFSIEFCVDADKKKLVITKKNGIFHNANIHIFLHLVY